MKIDVFEQMTLQDAFLGQLEPIWAPKRGSKGAQDDTQTDPKRVQNRVQNRSEKMIENWTAQGSTTHIDDGHAWPQVPTGGIGGVQPNNQKTNTRDLTRPWALGPANFLVQVCLANTWIDEYCTLFTNQC